MESAKQLPDYEQQQTAGYYCRNPPRYNHLVSRDLRLDVTTRLIVQDQDGEKDVFPSCILVCTASIRKSRRRTNKRLKNRDVVEQGGRIETWRSETKEAEA
jgi:hypothetical protein